MKIFLIKHWKRDNMILTQKIFPRTFSRFQHPGKPWLETHRCSFSSCTLLELFSQPYQASSICCIYELREPCFAMFQCCLPIYTVPSMLFPLGRIPPACLKGQHHLLFLTVKHQTGEAKENTYGKLPGGLIVWNKSCDMLFDNRLLFLKWLSGTQTPLPLQVRY